MPSTQLLGQTMEHKLSYYDLREALSQPDCPICRLTDEAAARYLDSLLWESVNDPGVRAGIRRARGFCHEHAWRLVRVGASLGVAIVARDVLHELLEAMEGARFDGPPVLSLRRVQESLDSEEPSAGSAALVTRLAPQAACPACAQVSKMERIYLSALIEHLAKEDDLLNLYEASDGLCLPHFRRALSRVRGEAAFHTLVRAQRTVWERLIGQLGETIRKSDYRFHGEPWGEEGGAWLRALAALSGARPER